jgi:UDP-N-acetylmuramoylalanine--D-glutamate ligase
MRELRGKRAVVVGMGKSGVAAAKLLLEQGAEVIAMEQSASAGERAAALGLTVGPQDPAAVAGADLVILSPGVPADTAVAEAARARHIPVIGDLELASWFLRGPVIGITGSNGKTTTTALTGHILAASGIACQVGGNIGTPPCAMVAASREDQWNVLELSSFQLETTVTFRPRVGAALNVTPDHLDRHRTFERYAAAKGRMFVNQQAGDFAVLNADDPVTRRYAELGAATPLWFSSTRPVERGAHLRGTTIVLEGQAVMDSAEVPLRGAHNVDNAMAAAVMAHLAGASHAQIRAAVRSFPGVEHRLEYVGAAGGAAYYNDSKATNVDAALKAIAAFDGHLWIILGGKDKDGDYSPLAQALRGKARAALLIGAAAPKIRAQLGDVPVIDCGTLENALEEAHRRAQPGDTVLLAPACASFDQFENYEHRGREFKRLAAALGVRR